MQKRIALLSMAAVAAVLLPGLIAADGPASTQSAPQPAPGRLFLYPERIAFEDGGRVEAERGMIFVPLRRSDPESRTIGIEIYRFPALDGAAAETPPIFVLNGGPGWPGLEGSLENSGFYNSRLRPLTEIADVVVVGQRGIGSSKPNTACEPAEVQPPDAVVTREQQEAMIRETSARCKAFWETQGLDLGGLTVIEAAADVADIREALGYDKITLWGGSFGSHWSMAILRFHPEIVARAVLTGLEGPDHTYDMPGDVLKALERMAAEAEASPSLKPLIPEGGLLDAYRELVARVESEPLMVSVEDPEGGEAQNVRFDADDVRGMVMGSTRSARSRRRLPRWPRELLELIDGDFTRAAEGRLDQGGSGFPTASFFMLDCGSGSSKARLERLQSDPAVDLVGPIGWFYLTACPVWESDLGEAFRQNFETDVPTVLVHGNWDVSTPLENALELVPFFKKGHFVLVKGGTHGAIREALEASESFREALAHFIATGDASKLPDEVELPAIEWEVPHESAADLDALATTVEELMDQGQVPGAALALIQDGKLAGVRGLGLADASDGVPVTVDTVFEAASLSKPVVAYVVLKLAERGEIDLDRPLSEILPHPDLDDPRHDLITARQVLSHTTGLPNWRPRRWTDDPGPLVLGFDPGARYSYSGEGFEYLRLVVERLTGSSLEELAVREVFEPLGMSASSFVFTDSTPSAQPHDFLGETGKKRQPIEANAAGSLHTTAGDYARFVIEILRPRHLTASTVEAMLTPQVQGDDGVSWGLGWGLEDAAGTFWHWGDNGDFRCMVMASPADGDGLVMFTNSNNGLAIAEAAFAEVFGDGHAAFARMGYPPSDSAAFELRRRLVRAGLDGGESGIATAFAELVPERAGDLTENLVNGIGYDLLRRDRTAAAIAVFRWNALTYPQAWNVHDSLGEALAESGDVAAAIAAYEKSLELNPENTNAEVRLTELRGG